MKEYDSYKLSDQQWYGKLPSHWNELRLKRILGERKERNNPVKTDFILSLTAKQGVVPYSEKESSGGNKPKEDLTKYNIAHEGDLLVNCMNVVSGAAGVSKWKGAISPVYYALIPRNDDCNIWYYHYIFRLKTFQRSLLGLGKGILMHESDEGVLTSVRMRISMDYLGNVVLPVPPRIEQDRIVSYLNWKTSQINQTINSKRRQIHQLREYRKGIIDQGILYGFDGCDMKDSGVYWLGDIPAHWKVMPLKRICKINASITEIVKNLDDDDVVTFLPMECVSTTGEIDCSNKRRISQVRSGFSSFAKNDVVVAKITPCFENGKGACLSNLDTDIGYGTTEFINMRASDNILPQYLYMITMTQPFRKLGEEIMTGSAGQKRISADFIKNFTVGIPSIDEQNQILKQIESRLIQVDAAIDAEKKQIDILEELKTRIISDAVTGYFDVFSEVIPEYVFSEEENDDELDERGKEDE